MTLNLNVTTLHMGPLNNIKRYLLCSLFVLILCVPEDAVFVSVGRRHTYTVSMTKFNKIYRFLCIQCKSQTNLTHFENYVIPYEYIQFLYEHTLCTMLPIVNVLVI